MKQLKRLAIITTHPIQYYAPVFKLLSERGKLKIKVFYTLGEGSIKKFDVDFNKIVEWDIPLLEGYEYCFLKNVARDPGTHHFRGIKNPDAVNQINGFKPDAILVYGWANRSHLQILKHFKNRIPLFFRGDSTLLDVKNNFRSIIRNLFLRWVYSHVNHAFFVGSNSKAYFLKYGLKKKQLTFAPHAIDNERFGEDKADDACEFRRSLGIIPNEKVVLFVGKFEDRKNPLLLLEAVLNVKEKVHLILVGSGKLKQQLKVMANGLPHIHFIDFQNQSSLPSIYQSCDIFCLPSISETWGLSVNEAMACGKAIVASDKVGCARDLIINGKNGFVFESGNKEQLAEVITKLLKMDLEEAGKLSKQLIQEWSFLNQAIAFENRMMEDANKKVIYA